MNIFKNMLFLQGYLVDPREAEREAEAEAFAPRYGNRIESERRFPPPGHARAPRTPRAPVSAVPSAASCG
jgi:hypothetical protein